MIRICVIMKPQIADIFLVSLLVPSDRLEACGWLASIPTEVLSFVLTVHDHIVDLQDHLHDLSGQLKLLLLANESLDN